MLRQQQRQLKKNDIQNRQSHTLLNRICFMFISLYLWAILSRPSLQTLSDKDNNDNDNIIKYLESNKDNLLDLAVKNYENLVEVLTNNAIDTTVASPSNTTLSLPQPSSTFTRYC